MKSFHSLTQRPHLYLMILVVIIAFILLALAAAEIFPDDAPTPAPIENSEPAKTQ